MKRADRLYALMEMLQDGRLHTAEAMAQDLGVSVRTIYRDMQVLAESGVPVEAARGHGYTAQPAVTLPPLNLTRQELEALHLGLAAVGQLAGALEDMADVAQAADSLSAKIDAVLPEEGGAGPSRFGFATHLFADAAQGFAQMPVVRAAIRARQKLRVTLAEAPEAPRVVRPLLLDYWGRVWTCTAWDETQGDFARFRMDRVQAIMPLPGLFVEEPGKRLADFRAREARGV